MELNEYQEKAMSTCMETCENFSYMALNLMGEVGEFMSKVAKAIRKGEAEITECIDDNHVEYENHLCYLDDERPFHDRLKKEAGDILWQLSGLCSVMGWSLEDIAEMNLEKLASRKQRGVIDGDGDNR